jgi:hypothetical protein
MESKAKRSEQSRAELDVEQKEKRGKERAEQSTK